ncbi:hypothetical protein KUTeg_014114 [Tegillarca granosa]|uniref:ABC transmembrane type-1 domain-containing protein n=1 Tax=Tegillarca granosa TaxID=220873 RepID=A0ABQ9F0V9_TEGGR|nr:hypothetical protein KUTeg_014114 [Tegillarca granosa]
MSHTNEYKYQNLMYIVLYAAFGLAETCLDLAFALLVFLRGVIASERLHCAMLKNILYCPMAFFDTTPVGRIVNRFISDFNVIDINLPDQIRGLFQQILRAFATLMVISYNTPIFFTLILPVVFLYRLIRVRY